MYWRFHGDGGKFGVQIDPKGRRKIILEPAWHMPLPWQGGPSPELSVVDAEDLFAMQMVVRINEGAPEDALKYAYQLDTLGCGIDLDGKDLKDLDFYSVETVVSCIDKRIEMSVFVDNVMFDSVRSAFFRMASYAGERAYWGNLVGVSLIGSKKVRKTEQAAGEFMEGRRPMLFDASPSFTCEFGVPVQEAPSLNRLYKELQDLV